MHAYAVIADNFVEKAKTMAAFVQGEAFHSAINKSISDNGYTLVNSDNQEIDVSLITNSSVKNFALVSKPNTEQRQVAIQFVNEEVSLQQIRFTMRLYNYTPKTQFKSQNAIASTSVLIKQGEPVEEINLKYERALRVLEAAYFPDTASNSKSFFEKIYSVLLPQAEASEVGNIARNTAKLCMMIGLGGIVLTSVGFFINSLGEKRIYLIVPFLLSFSILGFGVQTYISGWFLDFFAEKR